MGALFWELYIFMNISICHIINFYHRFHERQYITQLVPCMSIGPENLWNNFLGSVLVEVTPKIEWLLSPRTLISKTNIVPFYDLYWTCLRLADPLLHISSITLSAYPNNSSDNILSFSIFILSSLISFTGKEGILFWLQI